MMSTEILNLEYKDDDEKREIWLRSDGSLVGRGACAIPGGIWVWGWVVGLGKRVVGLIEPGERAADIYNDLKQNTPDMLETTERPTWFFDSTPAEVDLHRGSLLTGRYGKRFGYMTVSDITEYVRYADYCDERAPDTRVRERGVYLNTILVGRLNQYFDLRDENKMTMDLAMVVPTLTEYGYVPRMTYTRSKTDDRPVEYGRDDATTIAVGNFNRLVAE